MSQKKRGTDIIKPVPDGVKFAAEMLGAKDQEAFIAGVNFILTLNGHTPIKL